MSNLRISLGAVLVALLSAGAFAQNPNQSIQQDRNDIRKEKVDIAKDRAEYNSDQAHITALRHQLQADKKKFGPHSPQAKEDEQKLNEAIAELHKDNRERRADWQDVKHDENDIRKDNRGKWKVKKKPQQQAQAAH